MEETHMSTLKKIINLFEEETNPFADPRFANNGGGYSQPKFTVIFEDGMVAVLQDTSCGGFGSRYSLSFDNDNNHDFFAWGSMIEDPDTIPSEYAEYAAALWKATKYRIPIEGKKYIIQGYSNDIFRDPVYELI